MQTTHFDFVSNGHYIKLPPKINIYVAPWGNCTFSLFDLHIVSVRTTLLTRNRGQSTLPESTGPSLKSKHGSSRETIKPVSCIPQSVFVLCCSRLGKTILNVCLSVYAHTGPGWDKVLIRSFNVKKHPFHYRSAEVRWWQAGKWLKC